MTFLKKNIFRPKTLIFHVDQLWADELYSKTCLKRPLKKKTKIGFQDRLWLNAGRKYCRMLRGEHSAILSTFTIKATICH